MVSSITDTSPRLQVEFALDAGLQLDKLVCPGGRSSPNDSSRIHDHLFIGLVLLLKLELQAVLRERSLTRWWITFYFFSDEEDTVAFVQCCRFAALALLALANLMVLAEMAANQSYQQGSKNIPKLSHLSPHDGGDHPLRTDTNQSGGRKANIDAIQKAF